MGVVELVEAVEEWERVHFIEAPRVWRQVAVDKRLRKVVEQFRTERWDERKATEGSGVAAVGGLRRG